jgi:flavin-dependent dehydrogenase
MSEHLTLPDGATVVVVGGGPAGALFAIRVLRKARTLGKKLNVLILEKKREIRFYRPESSVAFWEGCNYCAGSLSPRLTDALRQSGLGPPDDIIEGRATALTVHGDWKSIELPIPPGRDMMSVFRGTRPRQRPARYTNFDSYLLNKAVEAGARVSTAEVRGVRYGANATPLITYKPVTTGDDKEETIEADFAVFAAGVNQLPSREAWSNPLFRALRQALPGFRPPKVRKALICEMQTAEGVLQGMKGEVHFVQYGSNDLNIEMSSLIPKGQWITVVLLGKSIDRADPSEYQEVVERFLELPHIRRLLPRKAQFTQVCLCHPNVTVGVARNAFGHRIAVIGDMVVSRLYKDGIFSAYLTASALADCLLTRGIDRASLRSGYWPVVKTFHRDNRFGRLVFLLNRLVFSRPVLSRVVYQALLTERKSKPKHKRRLAGLLWRIASADDSYRRIFTSMFHPTTAWLILVGGALVTLRNYVTERVFGLNWAGFGRYSTGVPIEDVEEKRYEIFEVLGMQPPPRRPHFERMYSIRIKADEAGVFQELGKFGDDHQQYFTPRMINVRHTAGRANEPGSTIRYEVLSPRLSCSIVLEKVVAGRYLLYRVKDGFAQGGVLAFSIDPMETRGGILTIYVAFDFPTSRNVFKRLAWRLFRLVFPAFMHDVLWNHSLCKLKHLVELEDHP